MTLRPASPPDDRPARVVPRGEVPEAFDEVADRYDLMVSLNPGYHAHLRQSADALASSLLERCNLGGGHERGARLGQDLVRVVDIGCGSGASTRAVVDALAAAGLTFDVVGVDGSAGMLREAQAKSWPDNVRFVHARAEQLVEDPEILLEQPLDGVFAAHLVRNVPDKDALMSSLHDVLRPGGTLVVHEYSVAGKPVAQGIWTTVCWSVVIPLGWVTSRRTRLYHYLWRSVLDFDSVATLMWRIQSAGFVDVATRTVGGWQRDIIHTFTGRRAG